VKEYGTADSGASLGDILGAAIRRRREMASGEE
jgi:small subunit ribosomal protein S1